MDGAGHELLADPGLPGDENGKRRRRDCLRVLEDHEHRLRRRDDSAKRLGLRGPRASIPSRRELTSRAVSHFSMACRTLVIEARPVDRLGKVVEGAGPHAANGGIQVAGSRGHDHRRLRPFLEDEVEEVDARRGRAS